MRSNRSTVQAMDDAWAAVVAGAPQAVVMMLTGVVPITLERMHAALRKLTKHAPECVPARMTWKQARLAAAAHSTPRKDAETPSKACSRQPGSVSAIAGALAMIDPGLPSALMEYWTATNVTREVCHEPTGRH